MVWVDWRVRLGLIFIQGLLCSGCARHANVRVPLSACARSPLSACRHCMHLNTLPLAARSGDREQHVTASRVRLRASRMRSRAACDLEPHAIASRILLLQRLAAPPLQPLASPPVHDACPACPCRMSLGFTRVISCDLLAGRRSRRASRELAIVSSLITSSLGRAREGCGHCHQVARVAAATHGLTELAAAEERRARRARLRAACVCEPHAIASRMRLRAAGATLAPCPRRTARTLLYACSCSPALVQAFLYAHAHAL